MKALEEFYDPADMSICVPAQTLLGELDARIQKDALRFPLGVVPQMTLADLYLHRRWVATSLRFGSVADNVLGMRWQLPHGKEVQLGSRVVKNVAGFDLIRFLCQSRGRLGKPTFMALRLRPLGQRLEGVEVNGPLEKLQALQTKILHSSWAHVIDACLLVIRPQKDFLWIPFNADKAQAGLIQAWLQTAAKDMGLKNLCRQAKPPATLSDYKVEIQSLPSKGPQLASDLVKQFGGRALAMGGLGITEYAPEGAIQGGLKKQLERMHTQLSSEGGHVRAEGLPISETSVQSQWEQTLSDAWETLT